MSGIKAMMGRFVFKPRDLKVSCDDESWGHKVKIVGFSVAMATVATTYQSYFNNLVYRSGMYQQQALAGQQTFEDFRDGEDMRSIWWGGESLFDMKIKLDILEEKDFKQLKFMQAGWKDTTWTKITERSDNVIDGITQIEKWNRPEYSDANGWANAAEGYYTQKLTMDGEALTLADKIAKGEFNDKIDNRLDDTTYSTEAVANLNDVESNVRMNILTWSEARYQEWDTMHDMTIWFDTGACMQGAFIGDVNNVKITPFFGVVNNDEIPSLNGDVNNGEISSLNGDVNNDEITPTSSTDNPWEKKWFSECDTDDNLAGKTDCSTYTAMDASTVDAHSAQYPKLSVKEAASDSNFNTVEYEPATNAEATGIEKDNSSWWTSNTAPYKKKYDLDQQEVKQGGLADTATINLNNKYIQYQYGYQTERVENWSTDISVKEKMDWTNEDLYRDLLSDQIDLAEDCDIDCQKNGSQLTLIAVLMGASYGFVALNALFMFIGTWRYRFRICSVYCTFVTCMIQFIILIVCGALLFTKYNAVCGRSMTKTMGDQFIWTMADDFYTVFSLWVISFIAMFFFVCCGLCSAYRPEK